MNRIKARRILENMTAINLALGGTPEDIGWLRIIAGENERSVGKWVQQTQIDQRERKIQMRRDYGT